jgi:hypothetical protein
VEGKNDPPDAGSCARADRMNMDRVCSHPVFMGFFIFYCDYTLLQPIRHIKNIFIPLRFHWNERLGKSINPDPGTLSRRMYNLPVFSSSGPRRIIPGAGVGEAIPYMVVPDS